MHSGWAALCLARGLCVNSSSTIMSLVKRLYYSGPIKCHAEFGHPEDAHEDVNRGEDDIGDDGWQPV
jgi:hypothetical protein